jgi:hypothetical protein
MASPVAEGDVTVIGADTAGVSPAALNASVTVLPDPVSPSVVKLAVPELLVVVLVPPLNPAVPDATEAVTRTPP